MMHGQKNIKLFTS